MGNLALRQGWAQYGPSGLAGAAKARNRQSRIAQKMGKPCEENYFCLVGDGGKPAKRGGLAVGPCSSDFLGNAVEKNAGPAAPHAFPRPRGSLKAACSHRPQSRTVK